MNTGLEPAAAAATEAVGGADPAAPASLSAAADFTSIVDDLDAMAPTTGNSALNDWMAQAQGLLAEGFDVQKLMEKLPPNASMVETYQHIMQVQQTLASSQQLMSLLQAIGARLHKTAETLLPKTG